MVISSKIFYRLICLVSVLFSGSDLFSQVSKAAFHPETSLVSVVKRASGQHKLALVYLTAKWCGPCKLFEREALEDSSVRQSLESFYVVKWDIDSLPEAKKLKEKYFSAVPSWYAFDKEGALQYEFSGYSNKGDFLASLTYAIKPDTDPLFLLRKQYESGKDVDNVFLLKYATALSNNGKSKASTEIFSQLWAKLKEREKQDTSIVKFIIDNIDPGDQVYSNFVNQHASLFERLTSKRQVVGFLTGPAESELDDIVARHKDSLGFHKTWKSYVRVLKRLKADTSILLNASLFPLHLDLAYQNSGAFKSLKAHSMKALYENKKYKALYFNNLFLWYNRPELIVLKKYRLELIEWLKKASADDSRYGYNYFIAQLYYDLNKGEDALKYAEIALANAKVEFPTKDPVAPLELIEKINKL